MVIRAMVTGSFDPISSGHAALVKRCSELFDEVYVVAFQNADKPCFYPLEKRKKLLAAAFSGLDNVKVDCSSGSVADYATGHGVNLIVRGIRTKEDADYELFMARVNRTLAPGVTTVFMPPDEGLSEVSSTEIRRRIEAGEPLETLVPPGVEEIIAEK